LAERWVTAAAKFAPADAPQTMKFFSSDPLNFMQFSTVYHVNEND
jgi:hypothetical protein